MTLTDFLKTLRRRWPYVVLLVVIACGAVGVISKLTPPVYTARASTYFSVRTGTTPSELNQGANYTQQQVSSYASLATEPIVLDPVIRQLNLRTTARELDRAVSARAAVDTAIVEVSVNDPSPEEAARLANAILTQLGTVVVDLSPKAAGQPSVQATIVAVASPPQYQSSPDTRRNVLVAALAGLFIGVLLALVREHLDTRIRQGADLPSGLRNLGELEEVRNRRTDRTSSARVAKLGRESLRRLQTNVKYVDTDRSVQTVVVTSASGGEGTTTVAVSLASAFADDGLQVVLVDADLRRPKVASYLNVESEVGLVDVLQGATTLNEALRPSSRRRLMVLPAGSELPDSTDLLGGDGMVKLVGDLRRQFEVVIIDTPPLLPVVDAALLARVADGALVVLRHGQTRERQLRSAIDALQAVNGRVLGAVLNRVPATRSRGRRGSATTSDTTPHWD